MRRRGIMEHRLTLRMSKSLESLIERYAEAHDVSTANAMRALLQRGYMSWERGARRNAAIGQ